MKTLEILRQAIATELEGMASSPELREEYEYSSMREVRRDEGRIRRAKTVGDLVEFLIRAFSWDYETVLTTFVSILDKNSEYKLPQQ